MTMGDRIKHAAEDVTGKAKEAAGKVTNNPDLQARGQADQASASTKKAGDDVADAAKDVFNK